MWWCSHGWWPGPVTRVLPAPVGRTGATQGQVDTGPRQANGACERGQVEVFEGWRRVPVGSWCLAGVRRSRALFSPSCGTLGKGPVAWSRPDPARAASCICARGANVPHRSALLCSGHHVFLWRGKGTEAPPSDEAVPRPTLPGEPLPTAEGPGGRGLSLCGRYVPLLPHRPRWGPRRLPAVWPPAGSWLHA